MDLRGRVAIVTGGANGIGQALCRRLTTEGLKGLVIADLDGAGTATLAHELGAVGVTCDVGSEADVRALVATALEKFGQIDLYCSNAGVTSKGGCEVPDADWDWNWRINVMAHVYAARAVVPHMLSRGEGCFLITASAAGLLTEIGSAPYSVTKHASVAFAEWLSVQHRRDGLRVSVCCPAGVATAFLDLEDPIHQFLHLSSLSPEAVADSMLEGIAAERFLILPHPEVHEFFAFKGQDYDRWLHNFARVKQKLDKIASKANPDRSRAGQS